MVTVGLVRIYFGAGDLDIVNRGVVARGHLGSCPLRSPLKFWAAGKFSEIFSCRKLFVQKMQNLCLKPPFHFWEI